VGVGKRGAGRLERDAIVSDSDPPRPGLVGGGIEAMEKLDAKAVVVDRERANAEAPSLCRRQTLSQATRH
jgi:hypothetical protein